MPAEQTEKTALTLRERQIVSLACRGLSNNEIASELKVSPGTIKVQMHNIFDKLHIKRRSALHHLKVE